MKSNRPTSTLDWMLLQRNTLMCLYNGNHERLLGSKSHCKQRNRNTTATNHDEPTFRELGLLPNDPCSLKSFVTHDIRNRHVSTFTSSSCLARFVPMARICLTSEHGQSQGSACAQCCSSLEIATERCIPERHYKSTANTLSLDDANAFMTSCFNCYMKD